MANRKALTTMTSASSVLGILRRATTSTCYFSTTSSQHDSKHFKLVVVGGGAGGCSTASRFVSKLGKGKVAVIEPSEEHFYQPMWTLVGSGIKNFQDSKKPMKSVLPSGCEWIRDRAVTFDPEKGQVTTEGGQEISYDYLVVAMGMQLNYDKIKGLPEAFEMDPSICSNYHKDLVKRTFPAIQKINGGNAIFTFPNTPIKCAGAPQKIMYLTDSILRKNGKREKTNIIYNTSLGVIFGVKKYAERLLKVVENKGINVNYRHNLIEVLPDRHEAVFQDLDSPDGKTETYPYSFMHITPPMSAPDCLRDSKLSNKDGYVEVNKETLQHVRYPNVFGVGDCTNVPTSKTAAAVAGQCGVLSKNLTAVMNGNEIKSRYDGYTSCPLLTGNEKCILAEFDFDGQPLETFPLDQGKERSMMYYMKKDIMPQLYWNMLLTGYWNGPKVPRKMMHFGMSR